MLWGPAPINVVQRINAMTITMRAFALAAALAAMPLVAMAQGAGGSGGEGGMPPNSVTGPGGAQSSTFPTGPSATGGSGSAYVGSTHGATHADSPTASGSRVMRTSRHVSRGVDT